MVLHVFYSSHHPGHAPNMLHTPEGVDLAGLLNLGILCYYDSIYSGTSEERTLWEQHFCPLFGGCPLLGGCLIFALYPPLE